ncbi:Colicin immunity protein / pyocin immunity protein [Anaerocolumna jejuensis DSM 15929]|uniref:Colicin immunity protein / pyocin immunity protein n=1 Tax=Anaerocolumna jejuensis DSM 15929 TaxID=1121322 RepID=A0A1M6XAD1_9FIRM|nr:bacteriocin immunity protein [Anaerocolumna jejuensis]SHL02940.1 Colicin immunity protein / pyocin immunity protein [Anaerocolumna jejuensis DSM 15929]
MQELAREELIELVKKIMDCDGTEEEIDNMILELEENVPHPEISDLIFWGEDKTAEQIVDIALNYKPIIL